MIEPGTILGHYEIVSVIGRGGMGEVWKARDIRLDRAVAIKTLPPEFASNEDGLARFEREAKVLASLNHPNIAAVYDLEEADGVHFIVLEFADGETLSERLKRGPYPLEEALQLALQLAQGLEAAHKKDVVHRDLKPANIKITSDHKLKVLDFGLAKALAGDQAAIVSDLPTLTLAATQQGAILGTPGYMSPEQARGEATDKRTDVWAFGCVLFEMITGQQTFGGKTLTDSLAAVIARDPDWRMLPANVHPRVKMLLERCLDKSLDDRYHDVAEARVDIEQVLADPAGVYAHPETPSATAGRWRFLPWAIAAGALAATVTVLITSTLRPGPAVPVTRFVASTYPSMPVTLGNSTVPLVAIAPDGSQIAYPVDQNGLTIYLRDVGQNEGRVLRDGSFMAAPFYSPNGDAIGFVDPFDNTIKRVSRTGSESPQTIYEFETGAFPIGISWTENGNIVFGLSSDGRGLLRMSARGGEVEELTEVVDMEDHAYPEVLPGARHILFTSVGADLMPKVEYLDLDSNTRHVVVSPGSQARYVEPGIIVYNDLGTLRAAAFDAESGRISGDPIPVVDNVEHDENSRGAQFAVSGNGTLVYINRASTGPVMERTLAIVNRNSTRDTLDIRVGPYMHPRVSPDGEEVAVQTLDENDNGIVWIYNLERNALRQLTQRGSNIRPIWTPTGERIAFASNRDGDWGIYWQAADGSDVATRLTTADPGMQHYPDSWSPDGRYLTFTNIDPVNAAIQSIWIMDVDAGSEPTMLVSAASGGVEFSPNGQWIAYRWNQEVFVEPFPQTGALHQVTQDQGSYPVWSPTGEALWYRRAVNATGAPAAPLVAVEVTTDGVFTFGNEQILPMNGFMTFFAYRDYDFMPDGERMVMVFPADLGENEEFVPRANVVLNWAAELGERLGLR